MASITRLSTKLLSLLACCLLALATVGAQADGISATRSTATLTADGRLSVNSRFQTELPEQLQVALKQGVPLNFQLSYRLQSPTLAAYRWRLGQLVGSPQTINYKLAYHPLTDRYRVSVGTFSTEYGTLPTALRAVGAVANWQVLDKGALSGTAPAEVAADVRLSLSISDLPRPFQINGETSKSWQIDSGWRKLLISQ
ncbi:DUF4390 domain-containing protein [Eikenella sp. Marseille-P7795]|uniref:DUF4390 domain-containing protein n=1 Tax=Eikenella sp. Marseille-P7795 TaxID=2866577 RepID=UPI001CE49389|nr:DUF4390 domain-containing protein [Eikenella sp. Marseille-P7795]